MGFARKFINVISKYFLASNTNKEADANKVGLDESDATPEPAFIIEDDGYLIKPAKQVDQSAMDWALFETPACLRKKEQSWVLLFNS